MFCVVIFLFFALNPSTKIQATSKAALESKLKELLELESPNKIVKKHNENHNIFDKCAEEIRENAKARKNVDMDEVSPFEHFIPVDKDDEVAVEQPREENGRLKNHQKKFLDEKFIEKWKKKFNEQKYTVSLPILIIIIMCTIFITCCCTLCCRRKLIALSRCCTLWRKKKKTTSDKDIEKGKKIFKIKKTRPAVATSAASNRAKSLSEDYVDIGIQNVEPSVAREITPPTGCCACCKKKRKQKRNK